MDKYHIMRIVEFDAGHRVYMHESKCSSIHGHRYKVEIHAEAGHLDDLGRVVDFGVLKRVCGGWVDENLDHAMIVFSGDPIADMWISGQLREHKSFIIGGNPTAEILSEMLFTKFAELMHHSPVTVTQIRVWETPNCMASFPA